jgi:hypothetical protein
MRVDQAAPPPRGGRSGEGGVRMRVGQVPLPEEGGAGMSGSGLLRSMAVGAYRCQTWSARGL